MDIDVYAPCPGGLNKKIKFCCHDLVAFLGQFEQQVSGGQYQVAIHSVDRQLEQTPGRACLLALKTHLLIDSSQWEQAEATSAEFLWLFPDNPSALAFGLQVRLAKLRREIEAFNQSGGIVELQQRAEPQLRECVDMLQHAMECCEATVPEEIPVAFEQLYPMLLRLGNAISARDHLFVAGQFADKESERGNAYVSFLQDPATPLIFKHEAYFSPAPADFQGKEEYDQAAKFARRGQWRRALRQLDECSDRVRNSKLGLYMRAILHARLLHSNEAIEALRQLASVANDRQEAIEYEALAIGLKAIPFLQSVAYCEHTIFVKSADEAFEKLQGDRRCKLATPNNQLYRGMLPKGVFVVHHVPPSEYTLVDEPPGSVADDPTKVVPNHFATVLLFGRDTDNEPRIIYSNFELPFFANGTDVLKEILGDQWQDEKETKEESIGLDLVYRQLPAIVSPSEETEETVSQYSATLTNAIYRRHWVDQHFDKLEGKSPREMAADPALHHRLEGLLLYTFSTGDISLDLYKTLRLDLGLPAADDRLGYTGLIEDCPSIRIPFLDPDKLEDQALTNVLALAIRMGHRDSVVKFTQAFLARKSLEKQHDVRSICYLQQAPFAKSAEEFRELGRRAAQESIKAGMSPSNGLLIQLQGDIFMNDGPGFNATMSALTARISHEPGLRERLHGLLDRLGILETAKRKRELGTHQEVVSATPPNPSSLIVEGDGTRSESNQPSKLWLPGQD
jgi:tetratricopeptide (TPR) repeat protein